MFSDPNGAGFSGFEAMKNIEIILFTVCLQLVVAGQ